LSLLTLIALSVKHRNECNLCFTNTLVSKNFLGHIKIPYNYSIGISLVACFVMLIFSLPVQAKLRRYLVDITAPAPLDDLLKKHLVIIKWHDNKSMSPAEWLRLYRATPKAIKDLLATEGYFEPVIKPSMQEPEGVSHAYFVVEPGSPALVDSIDLKFSGAITQQTAGEESEITKLRQNWSLKPGSRFRQEDWNQAKRRLLTSLLIERYPNASIKNSKAEINAKALKVALTLEIDSGPILKFGSIKVEGLQRYPVSFIENLNPIKPGMDYSQAKMQRFQSRLSESGYFRSVEVTADTKSSSADVVPIKIVVEENLSTKLGVGAGYSTNTGYRTQLSYENINFMNRGWQLSNSLKLEQKEHSLNGLIRLPIDGEGNRDNLTANLERTDVEGQITFIGKTGVNRSWGSIKQEQSIGLGYLIENQSLDGGFSDTKWATTASYGITLRHTDNNLDPKEGYLFNAQFTVSPLYWFSSGRFLQSYVKAQGYYPITHSTQLIVRAEGGMVNGQDGTPVDFLFRAGGDQSVRGYAYDSLGVKKDGAIVGGRYMATGSFEVVQWLTGRWGAAAFVDFGNASNTFEELSPVYGYGLGLRIKSPIGPLGADVAYGQETGEYRLHLNLGVVF
jgi:translocation and assembly module TamA